MCFIEKPTLLTNLENGPPYVTVGEILFTESQRPKGGFLSESVNRFSYLPKNIPNFYLELS